MIHFIQQTYVVPELAFADPIDISDDSLDSCFLVLLAKNDLILVVVSFAVAAVSFFAKKDFSLFGLVVVLPSLVADFLFFELVVKKDLGFVLGLVVAMPFSMNNGFFFRPRPNSDLFPLVPDNLPLVFNTLAFAPKVFLPRLRCSAEYEQFTFKAIITL